MQHSVPKVYIVGMKTIAKWLSEVCWLLGLEVWALKLQLFVLSDPEPSCDVKWPDRLDPTLDPNLVFVDASFVDLPNEAYNLFNAPNDWSIN